MSIGVVAYASFTVALVVIFAGIIFRTLRPQAREHMESPRLRMLDDEEPAPPR